MEALLRIIDVTMKTRCVIIVMAGFWMEVGMNA